MILKSKREARNEKDLYQKMLGQAQKLEQKTKHQNIKNTTESKVSSNVNTCLFKTLKIHLFSSFRFHSGALWAQY